MTERRGPSRSVGALTISIFAALSLVAPAAAKEPPEDDFTLGVGDELFWNGEEIGFAQVPDPGLCGTAGECFEYKFELEQGDPGTRLRVALSAVLPEQEGDIRVWPDLILTRSPEMVFDVQLFSPGVDPETNAPVAEGSTFDGAVQTGYAVELFVGGNDLESGEALLAPAVGTWTIRVIPESVVDMAFRMRAKLEAPAPDPAGLLYPNLRVIPPFEVGFPVTAVGFGPGVPGIPGGRSCTVTEITEPLEQRVVEGTPPDPNATGVPQLCLRYSMGLENAGDGVLRLVGQVPGDPAERAEGGFGLTETPLIQQVCNFKGEECEAQKLRPAGRFHPRHFHNHFQNAYFFELFEVGEGWRRGDPAPEDLEKVGDGRKLGVDPGNETLADWGRFYQLRRDFFGKEQDVSHCEDFATGGPGGPCGEMRLQAGWGDVYEWNRDGNYVDFPQSESLPGMPKEGFYVLRGTADIGNQIVESDETDNVSYAFFEVSQDGKVELIERGYGTHPWDPQKIVLTVSP